MRKNFIYLSILASLTLLLSSCAEMYMPRFDGAPLNPDITLLRTGEMLEGVKCAMVSFMHEREKDLLAQRAPASKDLMDAETKGDEKKEFHKYTLNFRKDFPQGARKCDLDEHWGCPFGEDAPARYDCDKPAEKSVKICVPNRCDEALIVEADAKHKREDNRLGVSLWDYKLKTSPVGTKVETGCTPVPEYSRFSLDDTQSASIQVTLLAINSGFVLLPQIDAPKTFLSHLIEPGNRQIGAPFPTLTVTPKQTTTVDLTAVMPQSVHTYRQTTHASNYGFQKLDIRVDATHRLPSSPRSASKHKVIALDAAGSQKNFFANKSLKQRAAVLGDSAIVKANDKARAVLEDMRREIDRLGDSPNQEDENRLGGMLDKLERWSETISKVYVTISVDVDILKRAVLRFQDNPGIVSGGEAISRELGNLILMLAQRNMDEITNVADIVRTLAISKNISLLSAEIESLDRADAKLFTEIKQANDALNAQAKLLKLLAEDQAIGKVEKLIETLQSHRRQVNEKINAINDKIEAKRFSAEFEENISNQIIKLIALKKELMEYKPDAKQYQYFKPNCHPAEWMYDLPNGAKIDFLGLKPLLKNALVEQEKTIYHGMPDLSLDQLVLTSAFQLQVEVSAGVTFFRFIPQLVPSTLQLKTDHTHTLRVTLKGKKTKGTSGATKNLEKSCVDRVGPPEGAEAGKIDRGGGSPFCSSSQGKMLESILQALEKNSGASSGAAQ